MHAEFSDTYILCNVSFSHFIVPELGPDVNFSYASHKAVDEYKEAKAVCSLGLIFLYLNI